jgi:regulator of PEP synthase PpsR (kinase-PPPase family)
MAQKRDIYYISGSTGILAKDIGRALLSQFPDSAFNEELIPFITCVQEAQLAKEKILLHSQNHPPLVLSTLLSKELNAVFNIPEIHFLSLFDHFLVQVEDFLATEAMWLSGASRTPSQEKMVKRVEAIHYTIDHDDGASTKDYDDADIILLGVSRSGKTPVSVFLATQMGIKTANYPLVREELDAYRLPDYILKNREKVVALSTSPKLLHKYRENRYAGTNYASLENCSGEVHMANSLYMNHRIPVIIGDGKSIEEMAMQVIQELNVSCRLN